jgi:hypothetical protein
LQFLQPLRLQFLQQRQEAVQVSNLSMVSTLTNGLAETYTNIATARATGEPAANVPNSWSKGYGAAGASLLSNITALVPGATGYPVNYLASMGTEDKGMQDMVRHITERAKACPDQKYVIGGHSQGSFAVQLAIPKFAPDVLARIVAVTHFGGKPCLPAVENRYMSYCNKSDPVCVPLVLPTQ